MVLMLVLTVITVAVLSILAVLHLIKWAVTRTPEPRHTGRRQQYIRNCEESRKRLGQGRE